MAAPALGREEGGLGGGGGMADLDDDDEGGGAWGDDADVGRARVVSRPSRERGARIFRPDRTVLHTPDNKKNIARPVGGRGGVRKRSTRPGHARANGAAAVSRLDKAGRAVSRPRSPSNADAVSPIQSARERWAHLHWLFRGASPRSRRQQQASWPGPRVALGWAPGRLRLRRRPHRFGPGRSRGRKAPLRAPTARWHPLLGPPPRRVAGPPSPWRGRACAWCSRAHRPARRCWPMPRHRARRRAGRPWPGGPERPHRTTSPLGILGFKGGCEIQKRRGPTTQSLVTKQARMAAQC